MKLIEMKCKNCGSFLNVEENSKEIKCSYCKTQYKLDDEVKHIKYDDMEKAGYEFERGRIKAQKENKEIDTKVQSKNKSRTLIILAWIFLFPFMLIYFVLKTDKLNKEQKNKVLWIIGWIFCFPIPLTILVWHSNISKTMKIVLTVLLFSLILILGILLPSDSDINAFNNKEINNKENVVEKKKIYKINSDEYINYVTSIFEDATKKHPEFYLQSRTTYSGIYLRLSLQVKEKISEKQFNEIMNLICQEVYSELKKNEYKSGNIISNNYEFIDIYFYRYDKPAQGLYDRETVQINIYEISKYDNYNDYRASKK